MTHGVRAVDGAIDQILASLDEPSAGNWRNQISDQARTLYTESQSYVIDAQSESLLAFTSAVLACHRALSAKIGDPEEARRLLGGALIRSAEDSSASYLETRLGIRLDEPDSAFDRIADCFKERGEARFGKTFRYVQEALDEDRYHIRIEKCFFNQFLRDHQAEDLTPLLCRLDIVWADELHRRCSTVRFARPTTLASGDDACRFQFAHIRRERS